MIVKKLIQGDCSYDYILDRSLPGRFTDCDICGINSDYNLVVKTDYQKRRREIMPWLLLHTLQEHIELFNRRRLRKRRILMKEFNDDVPRVVSLEDKAIQYLVSIPL